MTLYLMGEPVDATLRGVPGPGRARCTRPAASTRTAGRACRAPSSVTGAPAAPRVLVSAEAVPYRPNRGVYVVVRDWGRTGEEGEWSARVV